MTQAPLNNVSVSPAWCGPGVVMIQIFSVTSHWPEIQQL